MPMNTHSHCITSNPAKSVLLKCQNHPLPYPWATDVLLVVSDYSGQLLLLTLADCRKTKLWDSNKVWPSQHAARSTNHDHLGKHQESHCYASLTPPAARHCLGQRFNHRQMANGLPHEIRMSPWGQWMLSVASYRVLIMKISINLLIN